MNVYATYPDPVKSAQVLDDQRLIKMTLESLQILSTALDTHDLRLDGLPRPTHHRHPVVVWASEGRRNCEWLWAHAEAMDAERCRRWCRTVPHKTLSTCKGLRMDRQFRRMPSGSTPHANCARNSSLGIDFTHLDDVHLAYRLYLSARWITQPRPAQCCVAYLKELS